MNRIRILIACLAVLASHVAVAAEPRWELTPRIGGGNLEVERGLPADALALFGNVDTFGLGFSLSYTTDAHLQIEGGFYVDGSVDLFGAFDHVTLGTAYLALAYRWRFADRWELVPQLGWTDWSLQFEEGQAFNPGPEEVADIDGNEVFYGLGLNWQVARRFALGLTYRGASYEFGTGRALTLDFRIALGSLREPK